MSWKDKVAWLTKRRKTAGKPSPARPGAQDILRAGESTLHDDLAPADLEFGHDWFRVEQMFARGYFVHDLPSNKIFIPLGIYHFPAQTWMTWHIYPEDETQVHESLKHRRTILAAANIEDARNGKMGSFIRNAEIGGADQAMAEIELAGQTVYQLGWYMIMWAASKPDLDEVSLRFEDALKRADVRFFRAGSLQEQSIHSALPIGTDRLMRTRNMSSGALGEMFPFIRKTYYDPGGVHYGIHRHTGTWVVLNPFDKALSNGTTLVLGQSGRGKSTFLKAFVDGAAPMGHRVVIVDLENEFGALCQDLGGTLVDLRRGGDNRMNIFDLNPQAADAPAQGLSVLKGFIRAAVSRPLSDVEEGPVIHQAYVRVLQEAGIDYRNPQTWGRTPPRLSDFVLALREAEQRQEGGSLASCLFAYTDGMYADDFDAHTTVDVQDSPLVVFGLRDVAPDMLPMRIWQIQNHIWSHVVVPGQNIPTHVIIDEGWHLLRYPRMVADLSAMARRFRKYYAGLWLATHFVEDLLADADAKSICDTADTVVLFGQKQTSAPVLGQLFNLNQAEVGELPRLGKGEAILLHGNQTHIPLFVPVDPARMSLYSTSPQRDAPGTA
jgi:type IV secretory pathway VirB4 component